MNNIVTINGIDIPGRTIPALLTIHHYKKTRIAHNLHIQRLIFLLDETIDPTIYNWDRTSRGPQTDDLTTDLQTLADTNLIVIEDEPTFGGNEKTFYSLTALGETIATELTTHNNATQTLNAHVTDIIDDYGDIPISNLSQQLREDYYATYWEKNTRHA